MNGDTYEGAWASDVMSGFGTTKYANGNVYSGEVTPVCGAVVLCLFFCEPTYL